MTSQTIYIYIWHHTCPYVHNESPDNCFAHFNFHTLLLKEVNKRKKLVLWNQIVMSHDIMWCHVTCYHGKDNSEVFHVTDNSVHNGDQLRIVTLESSL